MRAKREEVYRPRNARLSTGSVPSQQLNFDTPRNNSASASSAFGQQYNQNQASFSSLGRAHENSASFTDDPANACMWDEDVTPASNTRGPLRELSQNVPASFQFANRSPPAKRRAEPSVQVPPDQVSNTQPYVQVPYAQAPSVQAQPVQAPSLKSPPEEAGSVRPVSSLPSRSEYTGPQHSGDMDLYAEQEFEQHAHDRFVREHVVK